MTDSIGFGELSKLLTGKTWTVVGNNRFRQPVRGKQVPEDFDGLRCRHGLSRYHVNPLRMAVDEN